MKNKYHLLGKQPLHKINRHILLQGMNTRKLSDINNVDRAFSWENEDPMEQQINHAQLLTVCCFTICCILLNMTSTSLLQA